MSVNNTCGKFGCNGYMTAPELGPAFCSSALCPDNIPAPNGDALWLGVDVKSAAQKLHLINLIDKGEVK